MKGLRSNGYSHLSISRSGGDPDQITIIGESGGASIMQLITAYGGMKGSVPFQQAIMQSPAWRPSERWGQESISQNFLDTASVGTLQGARGLSTEALQLVNYEMVGEGPYSDFTFSKFFRSLYINSADCITGPVVNGDFARQLPGVILLHGHYD